MFHQQLYEDLKAQQQKHHFIRPAYGRSSIAEIAPTVLDFFNVPQRRSILRTNPLSQYKGQKQRLLMLLIDGFGYDHFYNYHQSYPFFKQLAETADVYPLTSVFPSTTSAALTAIHSGLTPQEHGLPEWHVYFEEFDSIIETLPFRVMGTHIDDSLIGQGGTSEMLYDGTTVYEILQQHSIKSYMFIFEAYANTAYSRSVHRGSIIIPFFDGIDLMQRVHKLLSEEKDPVYIFVYWGQIDAYAHEAGPGSEKHLGAIHDFSALMRNELLTKLDPQDVDDLLFIMSADHGHVNIKNEDIINLNKYPEIDKNLKKGPNGKHILPTGSPHDVFLFIEPGKVRHVVNHLKRELAGRAEIILIEDAVKQELFGLNHPIPKFLNRIGNVLILPYPGHHVWYEFFPDIPYRQLGIHGGMSEMEMIVPLAVGEFKNLL